MFCFGWLEVLWLNMSFIYYFFLHKNVLSTFFLFLKNIFLMSASFFYCGSAEATINAQRVILTQNLPNYPKEILQYNTLKF